MCCRRAVTPEPRSMISVKYLVACKIGTKRQWGAADGSSEHANKAWQHSFIRSVIYQLSSLWGLPLVATFPKDCDIT